MLRAVLLATMITVFGCSAVAAQAPVKSGDHVRVSSERTSGRFLVLAADADALTLRSVDDSTDLVLPFSEVSRLDLAQGPRSRGAGALRGAAYGVLGGGVAGFLVGLAHGSDDPGILSFSAQEKGMILGIMGGLAGGVVGGAIGMAAPGTRWQRLHLPIVGVAPAADGGLAIRLSRRH